MDLSVNSCTLALELDVVWEFFKEKGGSHGLFKLC